MKLRISEGTNGAPLRVRAAPAASRDRIVGPRAQALKIAITATPNLEPGPGSTSPDKMVRINGWTAAALSDRLGELLDSQP